MNENIDTKPSKRRRFFKSRARSILYGDWLSRILAVMIAGGIYHGTVQFGASVSVLFGYLLNSEYMSALWFAVFLVAALLFVIPLVPGLMNFEMQALEKGKSSISDMFYAYESLDELMRSYRIMLYAFVKVVLFFLPSLAVKAFLDVYYVPGCLGFRLQVMGKDGIFFIISLLYIILTFFGFVMSTKAIMGIYVCLKRRDERLADCFFTANVCLRSQKRELSHLILSFVPLCILSLFTVGLLFVMYTIPYMLITVTMYCRYLYDSEMYRKSSVDVLYPIEASDENVE